MILLILSITSIHQYQYYQHLQEAKFGYPAPIKVPLAKRKGLLYTYYGYLPYWISTSAYDNFQYELLTQISYFSVAIHTDGSLGAMPNPTNFTDIMDYAHPRGVKMHLAFTLFGTDSVAAFLNSAVARAKAIDSISAWITTYNLDGVNIDFEYSTSSVKDSMNKFIDSLSYALWNHPDGRKELFIAMPAVPEWYSGYDYAHLSTYSDGLFIMAYDFHYRGSSTAGPVAPNVPSSFWGDYSVAKTIGSYKSYGAAPSKMVLGIPYYGYDWPTDADTMGSSTTGNGSAVIYKDAKANADTIGRLWDDYSLTPWYKYNSTQWHQCWYDDSLSIGIKLGMVVDSSLQGGGCWALGYDDSCNDVWDEIRSKLWVSPPQRHFVVVVNTSGLNIRGGPGTNYDVLSYGTEGERFMAFDYNGNWYKVYFPSASGPYYGWMWGGDGETYQYLKGGTGTDILNVTASLLNVRTGPTTDSTVITQIARGQDFVPDSFSGNWARIYLPDIGGDTRGWCYYTSSTTIIPSPEDSNTYNASVLNVGYPDTVVSGDTFTVSLKIKNTGFGPLDSFVYLKTDTSSAFYDSNFWADTTRAKSAGFDGLPNQTFFRNSIFQAPAVSNTTTVSESFSLERKNQVFSSPFSVSIVVIPSSASINLLSFNAFLNSDTVIIRWSVSSTSSIISYKIYEAYNGDKKTFKKELFPSGTRKNYIYTERIKKTGIYRYWLVLNYQNGIEWYGPKEIIVKNIPAELFTLSSNIISKEIKFSYFLSDKSYVEIYLIDILGRKLKVVDKGMKKSGIHRVKYGEQKIKNLSSGTYFLYFQCGKNPPIIRKIILIK